MSARVHYDGHHVFVMSSTEAIPSPDGSEIACGNYTTRHASSILISYIPVPAATCCQRCCFVDDD